jgi:hypothetical protein
MKGANVKCQYCNKPAEFVSGDVIYPHRPDLFEKRFYRCVPCAAYVGTRGNSVIPLGILANAELRAAKSAAHAVFDPLWKSGELPRKQAYFELAQKLGIDMKKCHIGMFDVAMCKKVIEILK